MGEQQQDNEISKNNFRKGILAIIGCVLVDVAVGEYNLLAFLYPYFGSYFHYKNPKTQLDDAPLIGSVWLFVQAFGGPIGVFINSRLGFKLTFLLFVLIFGAGQYFASYAENFYVFLAAFAIPGGLCQGALMVLPLYCAWRYFNPLHKPRISGVILSAYALAPIFTSLLAHDIINPHNADVDSAGYFSPDVASNVPSFMRTFGLCCLACGLVGVALILEPTQPAAEPTPKDRESSVMEDGDKDKQTPVISENTSRPPAIEEPLLQGQNKDDAPKQNTLTLNVPKVVWADVVLCFKDIRFWHMYVTIGVGFVYCHFINFSFKKVGLKHLHQADQFINVAGSIGAIFNAASRFIVALLFQKTSYKVCAFTIMFIQVTSAVTFIALADNRATYTASLCYYFLTYGGQLGLYPLVSDRMFKKKGALFYTIVISGFSFGALFVGPLYKFLVKEIPESTLYPLLALIPPLSTYSIIQTQKYLDIAAKEP